MSTGNDANGAGPADESPYASPASNGNGNGNGIVKGGPFGIEEMQRIANEMFRALPGAPLPGLDAQPSLSTAETLIDDAARTAQEMAPVLWRTLELPNSELPTVQPAGPPSDPGWFELGGDPLSFGQLGLTTPRSPAGSDPASNSFYFVREAGSVVSAPQTEKITPRGLEPHPPFDIDAIRADFPVLSERVHGHRLVWLDNGATTQKPEAVIERLSHFYRHENSNIHRGAHELAARATDAYEHARGQTARFLHAASANEIVFVRGTTEAINLVAASWGCANVGPGDEVVITWLEHHANIVPWQQLCDRTGGKLLVAPVDDSGQILLDAYERLLSDRTRIVAIAHVSNVLGTVTPVAEMTELAHRRGARVLIDGAQAVSHLPVDVQALDCDWYAFSGHKIFAPTGIGALYGKAELLESMAPWQVGGNMIRDVTFERTLFALPPTRFEAGTGNIADAVGMGAALDYVERIGRENIAAHERELLAYATDGLSTVPGLRLFGTAPDKAAVLSFVLDGIDPGAVGEALNREGIAVRVGHHCAQPIVRRFGHESTVRASLALYNSRADVDALVEALRQIATHGFELGPRQLH